MLKSTGVVFALVAFLAISFDVVLINRDKCKAKIISIIKCFIVWFLVYRSWDLKLVTTDTKEKWDVSKISFSAVVDFLQGKEESWRYDVASDFWEACCSNSMQFSSGIIDIHIIAWPFVWIFILLFMSILLDKKGIYKRNILLSIILLIGFIIWQISLLFTELYLFSQGEAQALAGLTRYSSNYVLGINCFICMYLIEIILSDSYRCKTKVKASLIIYTMVFVICTVPIKQVVNDVFDHSQAVKMSYSMLGFEKYLGIEENLATVLNNNNKVYILSNQDGYGYYLLRKYMIPAKSGPFQEAINVDNYLATFQENIIYNQYDYVYVNAVSETFIAMYSNLFDNGVIETQTLYKVENEGGLHLEKVGM